jgi:hypothetical protein
MIFRFLAMIFYCSFLGYQVKAQKIGMPNHGVKSHPTLTINSIDRTPDITVISLSIENQSLQGGWFCADKKIFLKNSIGNEKYPLIKSENIPVCPETHKFTSKGEILSFTLYFPAISTRIKYLDLIEDCSDACFYFKGIILDPQFNQLINSGYSFYSRRNTAAALNSFVAAVNSYPDYNFGFLCFNIIKIYQEIKNESEKNRWIGILKSSKFEDKDFYLNNLK